MQPSTPGMPIHCFSNGMKVSAARLIPVQIERYTLAGASNLHEPEEEKWFSHVLDRTGSEGVFLDVGAAIGYYSALVARTKPRWKIRAMEPLAEMRDAILETFQLNGLHTDHLTLDPNAVSTRNGNGRFLENNFGSGLVGEGAGGNSTMTVETVEMSSLLMSIGSDVTLMKMDIQGHEAAVLEAALPELEQGHFQWIILGTHGAKLHAACLDLLSGSFTIVHEDGAPPEQPDGLIVASFGR